MQKCYIFASYFLNLMQRLLDGHDKMFYIVEKSEKNNKIDIFKVKEDYL